MIIIRPYWDSGGEMTNRGDFSDPKQKCPDSIPGSLLCAGGAGFCCAAGIVSGGPEPKLSGVLYESKQPALHAFYVSGPCRSPIEKGNGGFRPWAEICVCDHDFGDISSVQSASGGLSFRTCLFFLAEKRTEPLHPADPLRAGLGPVL